MAARRRPRFEIRRVYDQESPTDAHRVLVDRLWPRGIAKADAPIDAWAKDLAPSTELRHWYGHDPAKFEEFGRRYRDELGQPPAHDALVQLRAMATRTPVALVTATRDVEHSAAAVLMSVLARRH